MEIEDKTVGLSAISDAKRSLSVRLFGTFEVQADGQPLPRLRSRKGQELLALMVLRQGRQMERSRLAGVLWPESRESQALANLRLSLTDLRKALGAEARRLQSPTPRTLRFDLNDATVDVIEFDRDVVSESPVRIKEAVALYRGTLLQGFAEDWALPEREAREQAYLKALEKLAEWAKEKNEPAKEAQFLRLVLATDPYRETTLRKLMTAYAAIGDSPALIAAYREFRLRLHEELQSQPETTTVSLYQSLLHPRNASAPSTASATPSTPNSTFQGAFPTPLTKLIGREKEIEEVSALLRTSRLVTLKGPGGSGKTRLAIALGRQLSERFFGQVVFVSLAELKDADRLPETVRDALHLQSDRPNPFEQIVNRLADQPTLLILDNYEHLIEKGAKFALDLLSCAPLMQCLVTSRHSLNLKGEMEYRVQPLAFPAKKESVPQMLQFAGLQLFLERAAERRAGFILTPENADAIIALCAKLEGVPLAIELVAAWANVLTPAQMLERMGERFAFVDSQNSESPARHRSLQRAFDASYSLLDEAEKRLLRLLSVFVGGWTLEAAEAICDEKKAASSGFSSRQIQNRRNTHEVDSPSMIVLLKGLVEKSLVTVREDMRSCGRFSRYNLLEMTRQYAQERLSYAEREETATRHAEYCFQEAHRLEADILMNGGIGTKQIEMKPDMENFYLALRRWQERDEAKSLEMMLALDSSCTYPATIQEKDSWFEKLETQPIPAPSPLQAKLYFHIGRWAASRTLPVAITLLERAYFLAEGCGDKTTMGHALYSLGEWDIGENTGRARRRLETCKEYYVEGGQRAQIAATEKLLIDLASTEKDFDRAQKMGEALLQTGRETDHWYTQTAALEALGGIAYDQRKYALTREYWEQALTVYPEMEALPRSNVLRSLGRTAAKQGDCRAAKRYFYEALEISRSTEDQAHEAWAYYELADVSHSEGDNAEAMERVKEAIRLFERASEIGSIVHCIGKLASFSETQPEFAAFLWIAFLQFSSDCGIVNTIDRQKEIDYACASLRNTLTEPVFTEMQEACATLSLREIIRRIQNKKPIDHISSKEK